MKIASPEWRQMLSQCARQMGVHIDDAQIGKCQKFASLLLRANRAFNLTAITDPEQVAIRHFADSMAPMTHIPKGSSVADLGSGAGFPGLVMAVFRPDLRLVSVESSRKKANFQKYSALELGLDNISIFNIRAEDLTISTDNPGFDVVTARALSSLEAIVSWAEPILAPGGKIIAMKGRKGPDELDDFLKNHQRPEIWVHKTIRYDLPNNDGKRTLIFLSRA